MDRRAGRHYPSQKGLANFVIGKELRERFMAHCRANGLTASFVARTLFQGCCDGTYKVTIKLNGDGNG